MGHDILAAILGVVVAWGYKGDCPFSEQSIGGCRSGRTYMPRMDGEEIIEISYEFFVISLLFLFSNCAINM